MSKLAKIEAITAVTAKNKPAAVKAAIDRSLFAMTRLLASAGVELDSVNKISATRLSAKLKEAGIDAQKRIEVKVALERAGLLAD